MFSQIVINSFQKKSKNRTINKIRYLTAHLLRQMVLRFHDPVIRYRIGSERLYFPFSADLPLIRHRHPYYASNIARIAREVRRKYPSLTLIDVGAFVGDTVAFLRQETRFPVLCIEGNERFFRLLKTNMSRFTDVECLNIYLNRPSSPQASGEPSPSSGLTGLSDVLDQFPKFARSKMLKIDTDGYDGLILRGATAVLASVKPVLFFEYDPDLLAQHGENGQSLWALLRSAGYRMALFFENTGTYMISADLQDTRLLDELHQWLSGYGGHRYFDVCLFSGDDLDLGESIRNNEIAYFKTIKYDI